MDKEKVSFGIYQWSMELLSGLAREVKAPHFQALSFEELNQTVSAVLDLGFVEQVFIIFRTVVNDKELERKLPIDIMALLFNPSQFCTDTIATVEKLLETRAELLELEATGYVSPDLKYHWGNKYQYQEYCKVCRDSWDYHTRTDSGYLVIQKYRPLPLENKFDSK